MMFKIGLTGSIGMGKTTTARLFAEEGCAVWDADAAVHRLYAKGGAAVPPLARRFPSALKDGAILRSRLKEIISNDPHALRDIEEIVHPLVAEDRKEFLANATSDITVFDIPLLFEAGIDREMDATVCVSIPPDVQKDRVMSRGSMTVQQFEGILAKQMPNEEKCQRSDFIVVTDTLEHARAQVQDILQTIRNRPPHA